MIHPPPFWAQVFLTTPPPFYSPATTDRIDQSPLRNLINTFHPQGNLASISKPFTEILTASLLV